MSDAAFPTGAYPGYSLPELESWVAAGRGNEVIVAEIERRKRVKAGDRSVMTPGERLRAARAEGFDVRWKRTGRD